MHDNFFHKLKVYYEDTDSGGVVYYANYLKEPKKLLTFNAITEIRFKFFIYFLWNFYWLSTLINEN